MPIYEYRCESCGAEFEVMQKISDDPVAKCIRCLGKVNRLISKSNFQLKGSGWYVTDYGKGRTFNENAKEKVEKESKPSGDGDGSDKSSTADTSSSVTGHESPK
ncbi:MAG: zinc ribbon domain-containing protein [Thermodesulfobacteriota bacterium]|nr:zinc ribbon domain-containing protein [Thermodesulfobacteriota bacterium]